MRMVFNDDEGKDEGEKMRKQHIMLPLSRTLFKGMYVCGIWGGRPSESYNHIRSFPPNGKNLYI